MKSTVMILLAAVIGWFAPDLVKRQPLWVKLVCSASIAVIAGLLLRLVWPD
jgi:DMSO reductase anchor subunit